MGKRAKGARWFVTHCAENDADDFIVVRGFVSYPQAVSEFRSTLLLLRQGRPPGFDVGVDLVDHEGVIIRSSSADSDLGTAPYVRYLRSGAIRVRFDEGRQDFVPC